MNPVQSINFLSFKDTPSPCTFIQSSKVRRVALAIFATLSVVGAIATLYTAFFFVAAPLTIIAAFAASAFVTATALTATLVFIRLHRNPHQNCPEYRSQLLKEAQDKIKSRGIEVVVQELQDRITLTKDEINQLVAEDVKSGTPFFAKHGVGVLGVLSKDEKDGLRNAILEKMEEGVAPFEKAFRALFTKEEINNGLREKARDLSYEQFIEKYPVLDILDEGNLGLLRPTFLQYFIKRCVEDRVPLDKALQDRGVKKFGVKEEEIGRQMALMYLQRHKIELFDWSLAKYITENEGKLQLRNGYINFILGKAIGLVDFEKEEVEKIFGTEAQEIREVLQKEIFKAECYHFKKDDRGWLLFRERNGLAAIQKALKEKGVERDVIIRKIAEISYADLEERYLGDLTAVGSSLEEIAQVKWAKRFVTDPNLPDRKGFYRAIQAGVLDRDIVEETRSVRIQDIAEKYPELLRLKILQIATPGCEGALSIRDRFAQELKGTGIGDFKGFCSLMERSHYVLLETGVIGAENKQLQGWIRGFIGGTLAVLVKGASDDYFNLIRKYKLWPVGLGLIEGAQKQYKESVATYEAKRANIQQAIGALRQEVKMAYDYDVNQLIQENAIEVQTQERGKTKCQRSIDVLSKENADLQKEQNLPLPNLREASKRLSDANEAYDSLLRIGETGLKVQWEARKERLINEIAQLEAQTRSPVRGLGNAITALQDSSREKKTSLLKELDKLNVKIRNGFQSLLNETRQAVQGAEAHFREANRQYVASSKRKEEIPHRLAQIKDELREKREESSKIEEDLSMMRSFLQSRQEEEQKSYKARLHDLKFNEERQTQQAANALDRDLEQIVAECRSKLSGSSHSHWN